MTTTTIPERYDVGTVGVDGVSTLAVVAYDLPADSSSVELTTQHEGHSQHWGLFRDEARRLAALLLEAADKY